MATFQELKKRCKVLTISHYVQKSKHKNHLCNVANVVNTLFDYVDFMVDKYLMKALALLFHLQQHSYPPPPSEKTHYDTVKSCFLLL